MHKTYAQRRGNQTRPALSDIDLAIPAGSVFGLLGTNDLVARISALLLGFGFPNVLDMVDAV